MYIPNSPSTLIYIPGITSSLTQPELYSTLHQTFSKFGLLYQVCNQGDIGYLCFKYIFGTMTIIINKPTIDMIIRNHDNYYK